MNKEELLYKYIEMKAEEFAKGGPKAPDIPQRTHELICKLAKESFRNGFLEALNSADEINAIFAEIDTDNHLSN